MFSLDAPEGPRWLDLPQGVRVQVRPIDATVHAAAEAAIRREARQIEDRRQELAEAGMPLEDLPDLSDPDFRAGWSAARLAAKLARYGILAWEGVAQPHTPELAERMMLRHHRMADAFLLAVLAPLLRESAEGNASAPAPPGSSAGATPIAAAAASPAPTAPVS